MASNFSMLFDLKNYLLTASNIEKEFLYSKILQLQEVSTSEFINHIKKFLDSHARLDRESVSKQRGKIS